MIDSKGLGRIHLMQGDITEQNVDAIVNAANSTLLGGGGVDGAIHRAAGPDLLAKCRTLNGCPTGQARITPGYQLRARYVIHTVGPVFRDGQHREGELLASCYRSSLELAARYECRTVAFPAVSCGVYGYPLADAAKVALAEVASFLADSSLPERVVFVLFSQSALAGFQEVYQHLESMAS
ncbi:MAG: O-acetyl-ADP-ribose deacetylase [Phycisphaerae bacterium]